MDAIIILTATAFSEKYHNTNGHSISGTLCFWGQWFERPIDNLYKVTDVNFDSKENTLTCTFSGEETLVITNPGIIEQHINRIEIKTADRVYFQFHDMDSSKKQIKILHYDFIRVDRKITGKTNIHWSAINLKELSIHKPAVLLKW
ncbi:MAG: hypothetical protein ABI402_06150 [Ferruginibacter sp.]